MVTANNEDLQFGVMTSSFPHLNLDNTLEALDQIPGIQCVEVMAMDSGGKRMQDAGDHGACHAPIHEFAQAKTEKDKRLVAEDFARRFNDRKLEVTLGVFDRVHGEGDLTKEREHLMRVIDFASALGGNAAGTYGVNVGTFFGWDSRLGVGDNLDKVVNVMGVLGRYAGERGVTLVSENCHMPGGWAGKSAEGEPLQVTRSAGATLAGRLFITNELRNLYGVDNIQYIWDPSHPQTQGTSALSEAEIAFRKEKIAQIHVKEHRHPENDSRRAYFGGHAMPGWFASPDSEFARKLIRAGVPKEVLADNPWGRAYGEPRLPGTADDYFSEMAEVIQIARDRGFYGRVIAENETPQKAKAVAEGNTDKLVQMYRDCRDFMAQHVWPNGVDQYEGRDLFPLDIAANGKFLSSMSWEEAVAKYALK